MPFDDEARTEADASPASAVPVAGEAPPDGEEPLEVDENAFKLQLPVFNGPLDLLLYLIEKEELEITSVSLVQVTDQYLEYLRSGDEVDATALAEFIVIGSKLIFLKSRALLPRSPEDVEEEEEDFGEELVRRLREYKRFKEAAGWLRELDEQGLHSYPRIGPVSGLPLPTGLDGVTLDRLSQIVGEVLARKPAAPEEEVIERHVVTVEEKVAELSAHLQRSPRISFRSFISACRLRVEVLVSFMAVLELIKSLRLRAEQGALFGDIDLFALEPEKVA